jgi:hypothetical protein
MIIALRYTLRCSAIRFQTLREYVLGGAAESIIDTAMGGTGQSRAGLGFAEGEWQREGLGKGLEQRLEDLVQNGRT